MATISGERALARRGARHRGSIPPAAGVGALGEYRFRRAAAWALWYLLFQGVVGLAWDIRWHSTFGRDTFWSPPHLLIYSGVALAGAVCIGVVLLDTWRYYRRAPGVGDDTTWPVLGVFRAPLGFVVAGCGLAVLLFAAPFDNWWHELYGLDVTLWAPFHVMGLIGAFVAGSGLLYAFAALGAQARRLGLNRRRVLGFTGPDWATLLTLSGLLTLLLTAAQPATTIAPTLNIGRIHLLTFPVLLCAFFIPMFVLAVRVTERAGAASLLMALFFARQVVIGSFVPWALRVVHALDPSYVYRNGEPGFIAAFAIAPAALFPAALAIDLLARWRPDAAPLAGRISWHGWWVTALAAGLPLIAVAPALVRGAGRSARGQLPPGLIVPEFAMRPAFLLAIPVALLVGLLAVWVGDEWGTILRLNDR